MAYNAMNQSQATVKFVMEHLAALYKLAPGDQINIETGGIIRVNNPSLDKEPARGLAEVPAKPKRGRPAKKSPETGPTRLSPGTEN